MRRKVIYILLCVAVLFGGCEEKNKDSDITVGDSFSYETLQVGYDAQPYFNEMIDGFARVDNGYYYLNTVSASEETVTYLMYFDKETCKSVPVCTRTDCKHTVDDDCDAVFSNHKEGGNISYLWYYDGNLYTYVSELDSETVQYKCYIYQISLDGSIRTKYAELFEGDDIGVTMYCHRGYVYAALSVGTDKVDLYRIKLEKNAEPELIYSYEGVYATIANYLPYEKGIAFTGISFIDDECNELESKILYYSPETGEVTELMGDVFADAYRIIDNNIYYTNNEEMYVYNMDTKENKEFFTFDYPVYLSYDGKYLYADVCAGFLDEFDYNEHYVYVLDLDGNLIDSIQIMSQYMCYFGDEDFMFQMFNLNADLTWADVPVMKALDKSQIGTGEYEWIEMPLPEQILEH